MSWEEDLKVLEDNGWELECESPFEISTKDGSFASGEAAYIVLSSLKYERDSEVDKFEYKKEIISQELDIEALNEEGINGWELVYGYYDKFFMAYFKRKLIK